MIYFPAKSTKIVMTITKGKALFALKLLLPLSLCALLSACDSHSSSPTTDKNMIAAMNNSDEHNRTDSEQENVEIELISDDASEPQANSLMATAKSDRQPTASDALKSSELAADNKMQATLIGDYTGIIPCSFCDSTQVLINLFADGSVIKTSVYDNPNKPTASLTENGVYRQDHGTDNDTITIVYDDQRIESYIIQNNHLVLLDDNDIADDDYTLSRQ